MFTYLFHTIMEYLWYSFQGYTESNLGC